MEGNDLPPRVLGEAREKMEQFQISSQTALEATKPLEQSKSQNRLLRRQEGLWTGRGERRGSQSGEREESHEASAEHTKSILSCKKEKKKKLTEIAAIVDKVFVF